MLSLLIRDLTHHIRSFLNSSYVFSTYLGLLILCTPESSHYTPEILTQAVHPSQFSEPSMQTSECFFYSCQISIDSLLVSPSLLITSHCLPTTNSHKNSHRAFMILLWVPSLDTLEISSTVLREPTNHISLCSPNTSQERSHCSHQRALIHKWDCTSKYQKFLLHSLRDSFCTPLIPEVNVKKTSGCQPYQTHRTYILEHIVHFLLISENPRKPSIHSWKSYLQHQCFLSTHLRDLLLCT